MFQISGLESRGDAGLISSEAVFVRVVDACVWLGVGSVIAFMSGFGFAC